MKVQCYIGHWEGDKDLLLFLDWNFKVTSYNWPSIDAEMSITRNDLDNTPRTRVHSICETFNQSFVPFSSHHGTGNEACSDFSQAFCISQGHYRSRGPFHLYHRICFGIFLSVTPLKCLSNFFYVYLFYFTLVMFLVLLMSSLRSSQEQPSKCSHVSISALLTACSLCRLPELSKVPTWHSW
jgi:hypothetical protein